MKFWKSFRKILIHFISLFISEAGFEPTPHYRWDHALLRSAVSPNGNFQFSNRYNFFSKELFKAGVLTGRIRSKLEFRISYFSIFWVYFFSILLFCGTKSLHFSQNFHVVAQRPILAGHHYFKVKSTKLPIFSGVLFVLIAIIQKRSLRSLVSILDFKTFRLGWLNEKCTIDDFNTLQVI